MGRPSRIFSWILGISFGVLLIAFVGLMVLSRQGRFTVGPADPPPGITGRWSPDVLALIVSIEFSDDYVSPNVARRPSGWRLIGPAALSLADGSVLAMPAETPVGGQCEVFDPRIDRARPWHCVVHIGLDATGSVAWIQRIDEVRADRDGAPVVPDSVVTVMDYDHVDEEAMLLVGTSGDVYPLAPDWAWSDGRSPRSGHPVFTTFDWDTGLVTRLEPVTFEG